MLSNACLHRRADHTCLSVCLREALSGAQEDERGLKHGLFFIDGNSKRGWGQGSRFTDALSSCFFCPILALGSLRCVGVL